MLTANRKISDIIAVPILLPIKAIKDNIGKDQYLENNIMKITTRKCYNKSLVTDMLDDVKNLRIIATNYACFSGFLLVVGGNALLVCN